ncbi:copper chaperone PCu(A)C [Candidatus Tisiphia endosymbiont of Melanophora roralis]|uniref:copper chaperone PCu(A)C n=1 Tax=Candidatus Tisiphia endosymbiont of Melanophora roralis TaxID=3066261 RepID=UPI001E7D6093|nr:MAG: copper chaperone PCu(A)C [Rickettsia endosymbiont of Cimex lectularius]
MLLKNIVTFIAVTLYFSLSICFATTTPSNNNPAASLEASAPTASVTILNAWARPSATVSKNNNSAIYFEIFNDSDLDYNLVNVSSDIANKVELHKSFVDEKGVSKMVKLDKLVIPAKSSAILQPGGMHIMLLDLKAILKVGDNFDLFLYFDNGLQKVVQVEVKTK